MICSNTIHKVVPEIEAEISIPILHITDATATKLIADGVDKVGLLGTRFTMEQEFYKNRLADKFAIDVVVPNSNDQTLVHNIIFDELCRGIINTESREQFLWLFFILIF